MFVRALIVVLITLNLGVFVWWMLQPAALPPAVVATAAGVAQLRLPGETMAGQTDSSAPIPAAAVAEVQTSAVPAASATNGSAAPKPEIKPEQRTVPSADTAATPVAAAGTSTDAALRCASLGPFADAASAEAGRAKLGASVARAAVREVASKNSAGYRVILPPAADRAAAQANVQRIIAAGLNDYYMINDGPEANAIALGRYRNQEGAQRRLEALQAAGFAAKIVPVAEPPASQWWLDVAFDSKTSAARLRTQAGAAQQRARDCAALR